MINPPDRGRCCQSGLTEEGDGLDMCDILWHCSGWCLLSTPQLRARSLSQKFTEGNFLGVFEANTASSGLACPASNGLKDRYWMVLIMAVFLLCKLDVWWVLWKGRCSGEADIQGMNPISLWHTSLALSYLTRWWKWEGHKMPGRSSATSPALLSVQ